MLELKELHIFDLDQRSHQRTPETISRNFKAADLHPTLHLGHPMRQLGDQHFY